MINLFNIFNLFSSTFFSYQMITIFSTSAAIVLSGRKFDDDDTTKYNLIINLEDKVIEKICIVLDYFDLKHIEPDKDGTFSGCVVSPEQAKYIYNISYLCIPVTIYAIYRTHYDLAMVPFGVFLTSINYWYYPTYSWRRTLDTFAVKFSILYQIYRSIVAENAIMYYVFLSISIIFYQLSNRVHKKHSWLGTIFHSGVHIFGNISNLILYSGYVKPFSFCYL